DENKNRRRGASANKMGHDRTKENMQIPGSHHGLHPHLETAHR
ncbi:putative transcriptional regulatory protein, partial [Fusarium oxysporum f. sp. albedinis]